MHVAQPVREHKSALEWDDIAHCNTTTETKTNNTQQQEQKTHKTSEKTHSTQNKPPKQATTKEQRQNANGKVIDDPV